MLFGLPEVLKALGFASSNNKSNSIGQQTDSS